MMTLSKSWPEAVHVRCQIILAIVPTLLGAALSMAESAQLTSEQNSVLEDARAYALQYAHQLPDFICTQITHREVSKIQVGILGAGASSRTPIGATALAKGTSGSDMIEEQLTYVGGKESYEVLTIDGKKMPGMTHMLLRVRSVQVNLAACSLRSSILNLRRLSPGLTKRIYMEDMFGYMDSRYRRTQVQP